MAKRDWYRRKTWTDEDQRDFFARLARARSDLSRAQYVRIQAYHLQRDASPPLYEAAIALLDHLIAQIPHPAELAQAQLQKAQCLEALGRLDTAVDAYRTALQADRPETGILTNAPLEFAYFAVRHERPDLYAEAVTVIRDLKLPLLLPAQEYQACAVMVLTAPYLGNLSDARKYAQKALNAAPKEEFGTVADADVLARLRQLAAA